MPPVASFNDMVNRIGGNYFINQPIYGEITASTTSNFFGTTSGIGQRVGNTPTLPALPAGVSAYIPLVVDLGNSAGGISSVLLCKAIDLGSFDIGAATTGVFTDGSAMPTATIMNTASTSYASAVLVEVTTQLAGTQTAITITYTNQDGTGGQTTSAVTPTTGATVRSTGFVNLGGTDWGVRDITAVSRVSSSGPTGVLRFWGIIPISLSFNSQVTSGIAVENLLTSGVNLVRLGGSDVLRTFLFGDNTAKNVLGNVYILGDS